MAITKEDAQKAYHDQRVRRLFSLEGRDVKKQFITGARMIEVLQNASNINNVFITYNDENFGVYEAFDDTTAATTSNGK
jgi:hypothetical protein